MDGEEISGLETKKRKLELKLKEEGRKTGRTRRKLGKEN